MDMASTPIRVLQVVPSLNRAAGIARVVYNWNKFHDEKRVHFDFLHHAMRNGLLMHENRYDEELSAEGSSVFTVNYASDDFPRFVREIDSFFEQHGAEYDIVHCHMPNAAFVVLKDAKNARIHHRILHSHLNNSSDKFFHRLRNVPLNAIGKRYATNYLACSQDAGHFLFGRRPFTVINNGIPLDEFEYHGEWRNVLRDELGIASDDFVIGCVGRFVRQKNYTFAVRVFARLHRNLPKSKLLIVGDGDGRHELEGEIAEDGVEDSVVLTGVRQDSNRLYSAMDVLLMPSLYEGLPVSAVEAQAAGLPVVYSTAVPRETDITHTGIFVPLDADIDIWVRTIQSFVEKVRLLHNPHILEVGGYSAKENAKTLMNYYEMLMDA